MFVKVALISIWYGRNGSIGYGLGFMVRVRIKHTLSVVGIS